MKHWMIMGLVLLAAAAGCRTAGGPGAAARVTAEPGFELQSLKVVGFLGLGSSVADDTATRIAQPVIEDHLMATLHPFVLLPSQEVESRAAQAGQSSVYREVRAFWQDQKKVDKFKLEELSAATGVDAVLVGNIEDWTQNQQEGNPDEPAYTRVTITLSVFPVATGTCAWSARATRTLEAQQFQTGTVGRHGESTAGSYRTMVDAPRYEDVVPEIARSLAAALAD